MVGASELLAEKLAQPIPHSRFRTAAFAQPRSHSHVRTATFASLAYARTHTRASCQKKMVLSKPGSQGGSAGGCLGVVARACNSLKQLVSGAVAQRCCLEWKRSVIAR